jgi:excisionase family DNA binding protein
MLAGIEVPKNLYGVEAAEYMRVHFATVYRWIKEGRLPAVKVGNRWRVAVKDLDAILAGER